MNTRPPDLTPLEVILKATRDLLDRKGADTSALDETTRFLEDLPIDSLDLATLIVDLEERTGQDPFRAGFRSFTTIGDLAGLYGE